MPPQYLLQYIQVYINLIQQLMSIHNKMTSDYLWVRHAPVDQGAKVRNYGFNYMYERAPNRVERLQMIYRSMGKQYDWELEKFRLARKPIDRGNKKRLIKNFMRFLKHPIAYVGWRLSRWQSANMNRGIPLFMLLAWFGALYEWGNNTNEIKAYDQMLMGYGKNVEGMTGRYTGFHDRKPLRSPQPFDLMFKVPISDDQLTINPTWRQNLRKELHMTNFHNVQF